MNTERKELQDMETQEAMKVQETAEAQETQKPEEILETAAQEEQKEAAVTMQDMKQELEESYKMMGDGEHDTDTLLAWKKIRELYESGADLTVEITGVVNKGVIALVEGIRGFVPVSRLSLERVEDLNEWLGKQIRVRIITADPEKDKLVLSAREILREERDEAKKLKISSIQVGSVFTGKVDSIQPYGAFVDLGDGVSGLVHVSQISTERIKHPSVVLQEGQEVRVKVIGRQDGKLKLSMKALMEDKKKEEEEKVVIPKAESIGTSMGDLLKNLKL